MHYQKCCCHRRDNFRRAIFSPALCIVTSDSFVLENYQVPFLSSKTRLKKTLIKVAYEPSVYERIQRQRKTSSRKNYNIYRMKNRLSIPPLGAVVRRNR